MSDDLADEAANPGVLRAVAWVLGLLSIGALLRLVYDADGSADLPADAGLLVWAVVSAVAAAFSACCAVVCAIKNVERRLRPREEVPEN